MQAEEKEDSRRPRGGRPKSADKDRRDLVYPIRLTGEERRHLDEQAAATGYVDISVYVRKKLFSEDNASVHNPKELFHAIDKTGAELKKIGANINQVTRYVNYLEKNNMAKESALADFNKHFQEFIQVEDRYVKAIRAYLRTTR